MITSSTAFSSQAAHIPKMLLTRSMKVNVPKMLLTRSMKVKSTFLSDSIDMMAGVLIMTSSICDSSLRWKLKVKRKWEDQQACYESAHFFVDMRLFPVVEGQSQKEMGETSRHVI